MKIVNKTSLERGLLPGVISVFYVVRGGYFQDGVRRALEWVRFRISYFINSCFKATSGSPFFLSFTGNMGQYKK